MRNAFTKNIAKLTVIVTLLASVVRVSPALAATATSVKDTMSTLKASATSVSHVVTMTLPTGTFTGGLDITYDAAFSAFAFSSGSCVGGTVANNVTAANVVHVTLTGCTAGTLTINFTGTNPGTAGSKTSTMAGGAGLTGASYAEAIVTDDQVSVTASVDPSITFNVGTQAPPSSGCTAAFAGNGGSVAFGSLSTASISSSDVNTVNHICTRVSTNAGSGAVVTVKSLNASLKSTSVAGDTIPSATAAMAAGTSNYGLCASATVSGLTATVPVGATPTRSAPFNSTCAADTAAGSVGALTTSAQTVWSVSGAVSNGFFLLVLKAAISATQPAHNDYTDTLTFVATGTF